MQQKIDQAIEFIKTSHDRVKAGELIDLTGFQTDIQKLCADISKLPVTEAKIYIDQLQNLSGVLHELEVELRRLHIEVKAEANKLNMQEKAFKSYQKTNQNNDENGN